jgi:hypothetical protein
VLQKYTLVVTNNQLMKYMLLLFATPFLSASECGSKKKEAVSGNIHNNVLPACVQKLIDDAQKEDPPMPPVQVDEYLYKGKKVYLFTAQCCDFYNMVYDDSCKNICAPSGGFTGRGDGKCPDFDSTAKLVRTIWKKTGNNGK